MKQTEFKAYKSSCGFMFIGKELVEVEILKTTYNKILKLGENKDDEWETITTARMPNGDTAEIKDAILYDSVQDYEKGKASTLQTYSKKCVHGSILDFDSEDSEDGTYWYFEEGQPKQDKLSLYSFYRSPNGKFYSNQVKGLEVYATKEDCLSWNTYKVIDKEGKETMQVGASKMLMLDDDQNELVGMLENTLAELRNKGVMFLHDVDDDTFYAYNVRNLDVKYYATHEIEDEGYKCVDTFNKKFYIDFHCGSINGYCERLSVKPKA